MHLAVADVAREGDEDVAPADARAAHAHLGIVETAVLASMAGLEGGIDRERIRERTADVGLGEPGLDLPGVQADGLFRGIAQQLGEARIDLDDPVVLIEDGEAIARVLDQCAPPFGLVRQRHLAGLLRPDVTPDADEIVPAAQTHGLDADLDIEEAAVLAAVLAFEADLPRGGEHIRRALAQPGRVPVALDVDQGHAEQLLARVAQKLAGGVIDLDEAQGLGVRQLDAIARLVEDEAVDLLTLAQRLPGRACLGDVARDAQHADEASVGGPHRRLDGLEESAIAIGGELQPLLVDTGPARLRRRAVMGTEELRQLGGHEVVVGLADDLLPRGCRRGVRRQGCS